MKKYALIFSLIILAGIFTIRTGRCAATFPVNKNYFHCSIDTSSEIKIGDRVPDLVINNILNYPKSIAKISDFNGKLVIIDFWATYCTPCVAMIPKMDSLQNEFGSKMQFLSVTNQQRKLVESFLINFESTHHLKPSIPYVIEDHLLEKLFPFIYIPNYVWIDKTGKVIAFTSELDVTPENIKMAIDSGHLAGYIPKHDIDVDKPLYSGPYFPQKNVLNYQLFIKGHQSGTGSGAHPRKSNESIGMCWTNNNLGSMYLRCGNKLINGFSPKNLILEIKDTSDLFVDYVKSNRDDWYMKHECSLDVIVPIARKDSLYRIMLQVINDYNGKYTGTVVTRKVHYLELRVIGNSKQMLTKGGPFLNDLLTNRKLVDAGINNLVGWLNTSVAGLPPVVDKTYLTERTDISISPQASDFPSFKKELNRQGLDLTEADGNMDMLLITEKIAH